MKSISSHFGGKRNFFCSEIIYTKTGNAIIASVCARSACYTHYLTYVCTCTIHVCVVRSRSIIIADTRCNNSIGYVHIHTYIYMYISVKNVYLRISYVCHTHATCIASHDAYIYTCIHSSVHASHVHLTTAV